MKSLISVASILACAFSLGAQITATLNRLPDGLDEVRIRNNFATSLVAFAVTAKLTRSAANNAPLYANPVYLDTAIDTTMDSTATPLLPNQERVVMLRGEFLRGNTPIRRVLEEPIITAGIFADGVTTGDAALLTRLMLRRSNMLLAVETALEMLSDAGRHNIPRDQLISQFRKMVNSVNRWYLPPEQQVGRSLYQSIIGKLINMPEGQVGMPFPPTAFVAQETAVLRQQRVTLLESQPSLADAAHIGTATARR